MQRTSMLKIYNLKQFKNNLEKCAKLTNTFAKSSRTQLLVLRTYKIKSKKLIQNF